MAGRMRYEQCTRKILPARDFRNLLKSRRTARFDFGFAALAAEAGLLLVWSFRITTLGLGIWTVHNDKSVGRKESLLVVRGNFQN